MILLIRGLDEDLDTTIPVVSQPRRSKDFSGVTFVGAEVRESIVAVKTPFSAATLVVIGLAKAKKSVESITVPMRAMTALAVINFIVIPGPTRSGHGTFVIVETGTVK